MYASRNATEARDHSCLVFVRGIKNTAISGRYDGILRVTTYKSGREGLLSLRNPRRGNLRPTMLRKRLQFLESFSVGAPRFELGTSCTPCKRATGLRHAPMMKLVW